MSTPLTPFLGQLNKALNNVENWTIIMWNPEGGFDIIDRPAFEARLLKREELATSEAVFRAQLSRHGIKRLNQTLYRQCDNLIQQGRQDLLFKLSEQVRKAYRGPSRLRATRTKRPIPNQPIQQEKSVKRTPCTNEVCVCVVKELEMSQRIIASQKRQLKELEAKLSLLKSQTDTSSCTSHEEQSES